MKGDRALTTNSQISNLKSQIPKGYKQTEVGVIPEDWIEHFVEDLMDFEGGSQPDKSYFMASHKPGYIRLIQIRDYKTDKYATYIPEHLARRFCDKADIMIGRYGPPIFQILRGIEGAYNVALIKVISIGDVSKTYVYYFLTQGKLFRFVERLSQRSSGQTGVDLNELRKYPFPLPPTIAEQNLIARALSDTDALIESLEQLLAKKRQIKQGAMQELLTGKSRLPGFGKGYKQTELGIIPEDWQTKRLEEISKFTNGKAHEQLISEFGNYIVVNSKFISTEGKVFKRSTACICPLEKLDITMVMSDIPNGKALAKCYLILENNKFTLNQRICSILAIEVDPRYLSLVLNRNKYFLSFDSGSGQTNLTKPEVLACPVLLPPTEAEQTAIATILSDMDLEIGAIETKLTKTRQLKQGMMHELLTGRIRLVEEVQS
jgi:type I restriction enzyme S subunit